MCSVYSSSIFSNNFFSLSSFHLQFVFISIIFFFRAAAAADICTTNTYTSTRTNLQLHSVCFCPCFRLIFFIQFKCVCMLFGCSSFFSLIVSTVFYFRFFFCSSFLFGVFVSYVPIQRTTEIVWTTSLGLSNANDLLSFTTIISNHSQ